MFHNVLKFIICVKQLLYQLQYLLNYFSHLLFGSKGIDLQQISQKLETLSSKRTFEPLQPIADSDIESFLKNERENAILSLIDEVNKNVSNNVFYPQLLVFNYILFLLEFEIVV